MAHPIAASSRASQQGKRILRGNTLNRNQQRVWRKQRKKRAQKPSQIFHAIYQPPEREIAKKGVHRHPNLIGHPIRGTKQEYGGSIAIEPEQGTIHLVQ